MSPEVSLLCGHTVVWRDSSDFSSVCDWDKKNQKRDKNTFEVCCGLQSLLCGHTVVWRLAGIPPDSSDFSSDPDQDKNISKKINKLEVCCMPVSALWSYSGVESLTGWYSTKFLCR